MVDVWIEHFLKPGAGQFFGQWVLKVREELQPFQGFVEIKQVVDPENAARKLIFLQFDTFQNLRRWSGSDTHRQCLEQLRPFMLQKQRSQVVKSV